MKIKSGKILSLFLFFLDLLVIKSEVKIYPDHNSPGDPIFNNSQVYSKTNERFFYFLGYYTNDQNQENLIESKKYGIYYEPVACITTSGSLNYKPSDMTTFESNVIKDITDTRNKKDNYFEEIELFRNVLTGTNFECPSRLKVIHDINLKITYIIPVIYSSNTKFTLDIKISDTESKRICEVGINAKELKTIQIDIKTEIENILNQEVTMVFRCTDAIINTKIKLSGKEDIIFIFNKDNDFISISNFRITVEDITTKTGSKSNKLLDRSKLGLKGEENCQTSNDCFRGHICNVNHCNPCHYSCIQCHHDESSSVAKSSCIKCNTLTINSEPVYGNCPINYIDISQFKDINVEIMPYGDEFNDRATIGLWLFFSDLSNSRSLTNDIYHIVLVNRMVISVVPWDNIVTAYCHTYEDLYRKVTSDTTLESSYYDKNSQYVASITIPSEDQFNKMDIETMNGKWFHISCGMSFDHEKFYLKSVVNGISKIEEKPLYKERLYPGSKLTEDQIKNDIFFNHIINEGEYLILKLKNFGNSNAKIYAKHLIFFKEYIDTSLQYMYFDFKDVKDYKEILYQIPFDELIIDQTYKVKGYQYDNEQQTDKIESYITLEISHSETLDFYPALNFYRLFLNDPNKTYNYINLKNTVSTDTSIDTNLVGYDNSLYLYDDNKELNCKNKHFFNQDQKKCSINEYQCDNNFLPFPGIAKKRGDGERQTTGYCDNPCTGSLTCRLDLKNESDFDYNGNFCVNTNAYNLFYKCIEYNNNQNYYLQFSGFYNTQTIELKNLKKSDGNPLNSYIIEFWFYPDYFLRANARVTQFTYPTYTKNFFFHSNVIDMYFSQTDRLVPYIYDSYKVIKITSIYNSNEWNNFVIYGKYYEDTQDFLKTVFVNHAFDYPFSFDLAKSSGTTSLQSITFCENKCQDLQNENIHWTTGYYRDLRIWDGDMASYSQIIQYDNLYGDFTDRINSILYHFPFSNQYISNNKIVDKKDSNKIFELKTGGVYFLKKYNYCSKFDIIESSVKQKYCKHASDPAFIDDCDIGCERCWERTFCYKCITNYYLSGRKCLPENGNYFFRNPAKNDDTGDIYDIVLSYSDNHAFTLCFWTKPIGFSNEIQLIITYGNAKTIELSYSSNINNRYGLSLLGNKASDNLIGIQKEFRDNIGKWTFISIAYHKEIKENTDKIYFPKMIKFEINTESIQADTDKIGDDPIFDRITIDKGYFGLFGGIKHYNQYIIQAIAYEDANQPYNLSPFTIPIPDIQLFCSSKYYTESLSNNKYPCFPDEKPDIGLFVDSCSLYKDTLKTEDSCMNFCSGNGWERCNCFATNHNSQMILNNNNKNLCRPLDYINFAKINDIKIPNLASAKSEKKCTLQFWMFAYPYINQRFKGITFDWEGHVKINLALKPSSSTSQDDEYIFTCFDLNEKSISTGSDDAPNIKLKQWVFLSCAVDYDQTRTIYLNYNTESDDLVLLEEEDVTGEITLGNTYLKITDNTLDAYKEWGLLFFRQIRLWKDAYFNAEFLSRVFIETPSKFQHLLHSWEPVYKGYLDNYKEKNLKVYDIVDAKNFYVNYTKDFYSLYGMNVIDENYYNILKMCSEDGFYYDITLKTCLQFIDLSKMKDFSFKELPSSYSGNYAMAFWIFFEDTFIYSNNGLHIKWLRHLQITIEKTNSTLTGFCFPQGYYSDYVDDSDINQKFSDALNKESIPLLTSGPENGRWFYVMCSVSYYNRKFYIQSDDEYVEEEIIEEDLFQREEKTSYPMRFYLSDLNNNVMYKSTLSIINIKDQRKIYLREILLFRNFIPFWYSQKFRYMNMRMLSDNQFPALLFAVNFAQFDLETKKLDYCYYERLYGSTYYQRVDTSMKLYEREVGSTFELSANFRFQPLCDLSQISFKKYDVKNRTCIDMKDCTLSTLKAVYCMEENVPLICESGLALTIDKSVDPPKVICPDECLVNHKSYSYLTPGTAGNLGICNSFCPEESKDSVSDDCTPKIRNMKCNPGYIKIGYKCIDESKNDASALFFSKCFNSPNFYRTISTSTLAKISSGYFYEFWMKLDNTLILKYCNESGTSSKEYYLYSTPHSIYKENEENVFYYQIINSAYKVQMPAIDRNKWNKIVIETSIDTTGQNVYVHTNFEKEILQILSVSPSISMRLQYISFCSRKEAGDCIPGSSNIMWGSAYYRNIRVWDIRSSSIYTIQDFNNGLYTEHPKSLVLFYPLDINNMDNNIIKEIISGTDSIKVTHIYSNNFQTDDDVIDYNYETNLIWELAHECPIFDNPEEKQVLVKKECINITGYYLKVPANTPVSLNIDKINTLKPEAYTICIYMKFIGIVDSSISAQPVIFLFKDDTFIVYDIATSYLIFYIGGSEIEAFRDINFHAYIGKWIPICIANFRSTEPYIHPHMITLSVNKIDIPFTSGYSIANNGIQLEKFTLGNEIIAYFSNFKVYTTFIQGNFANFISNESSDKVILIDYKLHCDDDDEKNCTVDNGEDFTDRLSMRPCCVGDYNIYENETLWCTDGKTNYFDIELPNDKTCNGCNGYCKTKCYNSKDSECSCDMTETIYWLRKNKATSKTYCEHPEYIDYSLLNDFELKVPSSSTNESTIEFWFFIYSYNTTNINFKEINIIWNNHNKVQIINDKNSLSARCYALWDDDDDNPSKFSELVQTISVTAFTWTSIRCGTNINKPNYKHFFNTYEKTISVKDEYLPYNRNKSPSLLKINGGNLNPISYGFLFIRELKLWQQYNVNYIDTSYIKLDEILSVLTYDNEQKRSIGAYPGLITLIRSEFNISLSEDAINGIYHITNLVMPENSPFPREANLTRNNDHYYGYNLIDPTNADYYKKLVLCEEGYVYNSLFNYCEKPSYTKCLLPGDVKDNCIRCPEESKYIHPIDGLCKSECPTGYYKRDDMNQCRPCNETCYKCNWTFGFNCLECIGERYLVPAESMCVKKCEEFNLTASAIINNMCTEFFANASIINYDIREYIDLNTFYRLVGKVTNYTSRGYTVKWSFDREETIKSNNFPVNLPKGSPFIGDLTNEKEVLINNSFFQLNTNYSVVLTVIAHNILYYESTVEYPIHFLLMINPRPMTELYIFPTAGLYKTTYFVMRCQNSNDTFPYIGNKNLQYRFFAKEDNVYKPRPYLLRGWSIENEVTTNFFDVEITDNTYNIDIFCEIRDDLNASRNTSTKTLQISKSLSGGLYDLEEAIFVYKLPLEEDEERKEYDVLLYHRSQHLLSLCIDLYKTVHPERLQTEYESSLDGTEIKKNNPRESEDYCNYKGDTIFVDEFFVCRCNKDSDDIDWKGKYCHIKKDGESDLKDLIEELFGEIMGKLEDKISWYYFMGVYNLFKASSFFDETNFFSKFLSNFFFIARNTFSDSIANNTVEYLDILDFYYSYEKNRMEKLKAEIKVTTNSDKINFDLSSEEMEEFEVIFTKNIEEEILNFMQFLANQNSITRRSITYTSENYYLAVVPVNPSFDDEQFFQDRKSQYRTYIEFMSCLNYIEMDKFANPYYQGYFLYIEYKFLLFGYNNSYLYNNTSPLIEMKFIDSTTGKEISVTGCEGNNQIIIHMPFTNANFLEEFNYQKLLYDPSIYKSPDDPIFSDPVYIEENGMVSDDTIEQRIEKYSRRYNISPRYYDSSYKRFDLDGINYINFTNDKNFIEYGSNHLCKFTTFIIPNNATYHPNGRFYYLARPRILKWFPNYYQSYGSLIFLVFLVLYFIYMIICICYDSQFTNQEDLLNYIKEEIVKNFYPYAKNKKRIVEKLIPTKMNVDFQPEIKFGPNAKVLPKDRILSTLNEGKISEKERILTLNKSRNKNKNIDDEIFSEENEDEKNNEKATSNRKLKNQKVRKKLNNFIKEKPLKIQKKINEEAKKNDNDDYESEIDRELGNVNRATFTINYLPKDFEKSKEEKERRLENYSHLKMTSGQFFSANYKLRTTLINSLCNVSLFQPRWKKLTMLVTEIGLMILVISILLTIDEKAKLKNGLIIIGYLFAYGLAASTFSNLVMYCIALSFHFPKDTANRLYKLVLFNGQLIVLKEWEEICFAQGLKAIPGMIFCVIFWAISLYVGLGFTAVWSDQNFEFLISFAFAFVLNFFIMELIVEGIIAIFYIGRKKYNCTKKFGYFLNRLRNYRCLSS